MKKFQTFFSFLFEILLDSNIGLKIFLNCLRMMQFEYGDWLAVQCGCPSYEEWRKQMFYAVARVKKAQPEKFRDVWDYQDLILQAHQDFSKYLPNKVNKYGDKKLISW